MGRFCHDCGYAVYGERVGGSRLYPCFSEDYGGAVGARRYAVDGFVAVLPFYRQSFVLGEYGGARHTIASKTSARIIEMALLFILLLQRVKERDESFELGFVFEWKCYTASSLFIARKLHRSAEYGRKMLFSTS